MEEHEHKLVAPPDFELPPLDELLDGLGHGAVEQIEQEATYFDTPDLRLSRAGASLRYRSDDGWTVKIPRSQQGDAFERTEVSFQGERGLPPAPATELVRVWARTAPLGVVARIRTQRTRVELCDDAGHVLGEIDDDQVTGTAMHQQPVAFHEIEVETSEAAPAKAVDRLVHRIRKAGAGSGPAMPKITRALGPDAQAPPDLSPPRSVRTDATVEQLVRAVITDSVLRLTEHDPAIRLDAGAEAVHQARVATRRLRSDLRTFRPVLDPSWSEPLRVELRWLGGALGKVRDADVLLGLLEAKCGALDPASQDPARELLDRLAAMRERDREELLDALRSDRYATLLDRLVAATRSPRFRDHARRRRAAKVVGRLIRPPWKRVRKGVRRLSDDPEDAQLHEVRKRAKQARYALEAVSPVTGKRAARAAKRLADLQDVLGDHQDAVVAARWLHDAAVDSEQAETAYVAGVLAGSFHEDRRRLRREWAGTWRRAQRAHHRI
ncbi:MAG TPA: CYTH and CHAD domain-containing protein [Acidimicrobiia bacterium]|jgi:CHAD domain-containing protein